MQRLILGLATILALLILGSGSFAPAAHAIEHESCLVACGKCEDKCEETLTYCRKGDAKHRATKHISALEDCISTCKLSRELITRKSPLTAQSCAICADACKRCAQSCDSFKDNKKMQDCAAECRKCETMCESMSGH